MSNYALGKPDVQRREVYIVNYLRDKPEGATVSEIHAEVGKLIGDAISRPAYDKLLKRLEASGKIEADDSKAVRRYILPPQLHAANRLTLDDVYELLPFFESSETMARAIEAQQYFFEHRHTIIKEAAEALVQEDAANLFWEWINSLILELESGLESYQWVEAEGPHLGQRVFADVLFEHQLQTQCETLREILYRQLSVPFKAVDIPEWDGPNGLRRGGRIFYRPEALRAVLAVRVFGAGAKRTVLGLVTIDQDARDSAEEEMVISGSDGSFHAGTVGIRTAQGYIEDESFIVTFNNSVAYIRSSERLVEQYGEKKFVYSAPLTRDTIDDPAYKGMTLAPFMFPMLTDSEYEHMSRAATDVVQIRVDEEVFKGTAREVVSGTKIPIPRVHIRDGTITPQSRGFNHYYRMDPYGEITREGIDRLRNILQRIKGARNPVRTPQVYVGAVKSTQIRLFSRLVTWYIARGSKLTRGRAIAPEWDERHAGFISDIDVMTTLLASLAPQSEKNGFWVSCVVLRQFPALTDFYVHRLTGQQSWFDILNDMRKDALAHHEKYGGALPYHATLSEDALQEDSYLYLLEHGDYASFYIGHTFGDPPPKIPRYEFLCSLREKQTDPDYSRQLVERNVQQIVTALLTCRFTQDRDHNFLSRMNLTKLIPAVVYQAHEYAKHLGKKLEGEYRSVVIARLIARKKLPSGVGSAEVGPIGIRRYLQRFVDARKSLPPPEREDEER